MSAKENDESNSSGEASGPLHCTFAATGCHAALQEIYVRQNCPQTKKQAGENDEMMLLLLVTRMVLLFVFVKPVQKHVMLAMKVYNMLD